MAIQNPSADQIRRIAEGLGLRVDAEDVESYRALVEANLGALAAVDAMADETPPPAYPRDGGERPPAAENPLGAWYVRTHLEGAAEGKLAGRTVALKDNVFLAGVPLMNGTSILEGYVPPVDATIVTRMLDAGAHIVGKAVCEAYCFSGGSHTSATGMGTDWRDNDPEVEPVVEIYQGHRQSYEHLGAPAAAQPDDARTTPPSPN